MSRVTRAKLTFIAIIVTLGFGVVGIVGFIIYDQQTRLVQLTDRVTEKNAIIAEKDDQIASLTANLIASQENAQPLYDQLLALPGVEPDGEDPADFIIGPIGPSGASGDRGQQGLPGERGASGPPGPTGPQGDTGESGATGSTGESVTGPQGVQGPQGDTGPQGPSGPSCPEAYELRIVTILVVDPITSVPEPTSAAVCLPTPVPDSPTEEVTSP